AYFLKLRKENFSTIIVDIPHYLSKQGIKAIIAPVETRYRRLYAGLQDRGVNYALILYPFIAGKDGYQVNLTEQHWTLIGRTLKKVHTAMLPSTLASQVPEETFAAQWRESVKQFLAQIEVMTYKEQVAKKLATTMLAKHKEISYLVHRADELARLLKQQPGDYVLCHSDLHPGNFLIADTGELYLVDWDNPIYAPKECDLMFFGAGMSGDQLGGRQEESFYKGYGRTDIDWSALAYYRYERIIQDIAEFCKQLLLTTSGGEDREQAYEYFLSSFRPGGVIDAAARTDQMVSSSK
ncbi:MAG TPA: aminoglycoside phosphotransferase family protein, partial [Anaerolineales bacterium]